MSCVLHLDERFEHFLNITVAKASTSPRTGLARIFLPTASEQSRVGDTKLSTALRRDSLGKPRRLAEHVDGGRTGYPIVDAAMHQMNATDWMHNRVRMIVASFLCKDLLIDWRLGEAIFMRRLIDGDVANNVGNWQWAAGTGADAVPYFRIFNPPTQGQKFDPQGIYIRKWLPALANRPTEFIHTPHKMSAEQQKRAGCILGYDYPYPIVEHTVQRRRALAMCAAGRS